MANGWSVTYTKGRIAEKAGHNTTAIESYREALKSTTGELKAEIAYRLGHLLLAADDFAGAISPLEVAAESSPSSAQRHYRLGFAYQKLENWNDASKFFENAIRLEGSKADWHYRLGQCREKLGLNTDAISSFRSAIAINANMEYFHDALLRVTRKTGQAQLVNDVLVNAVAIFPNKSSWQKRLADSYLKMKNPENTASFFEKMNKSKDANSMSFFRQGQALLELGHENSSRAAFKEALSRDKTLGANRFGLGVFYQHGADYYSAAREYKLSLRQNGHDPELHYRFGFSLERSYHWEGAEAAYELALILAPKKETWFYRLGLVRERLGKWAEAASAYKAACSLHQGKNSYWLYRQAFCMRMDSDFKGSAEVFAVSAGKSTAWLSTSPDETQMPSTVLEPHLTWGKNRLPSILDLQDARASYAAGVNFVADGDYDSACVAFRDACQRTETFESKYYAGLGEALAFAGKYEEAACAFTEMRILKQPHGVNADKYSKSPGLLQQIHYAEYLDTLEIDHDVVLFESGSGAFIGCNPLAIYKGMSHNPKYVKYRFVWVINDKRRIPEFMLDDNRITFVAKGSDGYLRYIASAGRLINNNTFPVYFSRRPEQKYLNTWHGIPLKTLGRDIRSGEMDHKNAARNLLHTTHLLSPNGYFTSILIDKNDISGLFSGKIAEVGYPRVDQIVRAKESPASTLRARLGIGGNERVVLYAPTWRGDLSRRLFDDARLMSDIEALRTTGCRVLFKGHAMIEKELANSELGDLVVPSDIDANELLTVVDVLVTDYSSILFDFLPSGKELYLYVYDFQEYQEDRGLYLELDRLPGVVATSIEQLINEIKSNSATGLNDERWTWAKREFFPMEDGEATTRAIDFFLEDDDSHVVDVSDRRENVLFFQGSFIPNGISAAFSSLIRGIDTDRYRPVVVLEPGALFQNENRLDNYNQSKNEFQTIGRVGGMLANLEERWVIDRMNARDTLDHDRMWSIYNAAFAREYRRMFGDTAFESVICFEGYARFWAALLANGPQPKTGRSIYLHNDMIREYSTRFKYLIGMFQLYETYDNLISVSKSVGELNRDELSARFELGHEKFFWINNLIEPDRIIKMSKEPLPHLIEEWLSDSSFTFVNVARLSPEKDQSKLIHAFAALKRETSRNVKLLIVGEGPLRQQLQQLVIDLGVPDNVYFTGLEANPYSIMNSSDAFVFSSNYEGQGLVVLESLVLGLAVVSTNVVGPKSVLENGEGMLVENSQEGLLAGMRALLDGPRIFTSFDATEYNAQALARFENRVLQKNGIEIV